VEAFSLVVLSELGDKVQSCHGAPLPRWCRGAFTCASAFLAVRSVTRAPWQTFFVAGLFAMKTNRAIAFTGAILALAVMTSVAVFLGQVQLSSCSAFPRSRPSPCSARARTGQR